MPVKAITIKGNSYVMVAERVRLAHEEEAFSMVEECVVEAAGRFFVRVIITVKDKQYIGTSEIKFNATKGTADGDSPYECAQTSAVGRALGFAGYGSIESIASLDEIVRNQEASGSVKKTRQDIIDAYDAGKLAGAWKTTSEFYAAASAVTKKAINKQNVNALSSDDLAELLGQEAA